MAKRTAADANLPEIGGVNDTPYCQICGRADTQSPLVQDCRGGLINTPSSSYSGNGHVHLSCLVKSAKEIQPLSINDDNKSNINQESNVNHMSNTFNDYLDTCGNSDDDSQRIFSCISFTYMLSNLDRMIESERFLLKTIDTSMQLFGANHSCTQAAELALRQKKLRFVILEFLGKTCVFRALRYMMGDQQEGNTTLDEESCMVVQGPINNNCGVSRNNTNGEQPQPQQQILVFPSKSIVPTLGTPVICRGCLKHQAHLNGKIGDVRAINRVTGECEIHFESITMEPQLIKAEYLRVLFDLPECQNLDYKFTTNEVIDNRYKLIERVGKGAFGQVVKAMDTQTDCEVAIKIIKRSAPKQNFLLQAQTEIKLLTQIHMKDPLGRHNIVRLLNTFMHKNHQCIVFEPLAKTLYQLLVNTKFRGLQLDAVRSFAKRLLQALAYLARPDVDIIHCDLKPENVMLENPKRSGVKLIDFGSACKSSEKSYTYIQSRFYRSPEVILGLPYSVAIDMWSLGCMLVEMYTGEPLFAGSDEVNMVHRFVAILGMPPDEMIQQVKKDRQSKFFQKNEGKWTIKQSHSTGGKTNAITPSHNPKASLTEAIAKACTNVKKSHVDHGFVDMILQMLTYQPQNRFRPEQGLQHSFIVEKLI
mmetsp:Transcript_23521/g.40070  ORF Transcript_23521/g.40070 Transcript_23521/m.40070 type:complete len:646 (+) Transcript_23521:93-2030(+)